ncbi:MAG: ABC transporter permease [Myxococcota bacterium]
MSARAVGAAIGARILAAVATLVGATALLLALLVWAPGDPIDVVTPIGADAALRPQLEREFGLDRPATVRWLSHLARFATLDLGTSYAYRPGAPVAELLPVPAARTFGLVAGASALVVGWGTALALATAGRPSIVRSVVHAISLAPGFALAHAAVASINAVTWWAITRGTVARPEWFALPDQPSAVRTSVAVVVLAVGSGALAEVHAEVEDAIVRIRTSPWIDAARARGASTWPLVLRALIPSVAATLAGRATLLVSGAVVIENVLLLRGIGAVLWRAAELRDYELALSIAVLLAGFVAGARLLADGVRFAVDPRLREAAG